MCTMKNQYNIFFSVLLCLCSISNTFAQNVSTEGRTFWLSFMNVSTQNPIEYLLFITSKTNTSGSVKIPLQGITLTFTVAANQTTTMVLPNPNVDIGQSTGTFSKGIYVSALADISVYAVMKSNFRTEASVVLPTTSFGGTTEYIVNTPSSIASVGGVISRTEFVIVAMKDDTDVVVTPSVITSDNKPAQVPFTVQLDSGQVYQVQSKLVGETANTDLTGTTIAGAGSCKPFSVFSGATATQIGGCGNWQHLYEQNYPIKTWGKEYLVVPFANHNDGYVAKIVASENNTSINIKVGTNPSTVVPLNKGQSHQINVTASSNFQQGVCITADKPISVAQLMKGQVCNGSSVGDPSMLMLNPINQTVKKVTFNTISTPGGDIMNTHFVNVIVKTPNINKIKAFGNLISSSLFTPIQTCTGYSYAMLSIGEGKDIDVFVNSNTGASVTLESDSTFIAYAYGYGNASAYAYSAGASFENQRYNFNFSPATTCITSPTVTFNGSGTNVTSYLWDFGDGSPTVSYIPPVPGTPMSLQHTFPAVGVYSVKLTVTIVDGCGSDYVIKQFEVLPVPAPALGVDRSFCAGTSTVLNPAHPTLTVGSPTYKWYKDNVLITGATSPTLTVTQAGTYKVDVGNAGGCSGTDEIVMNINPLPIIDIVGLNTSQCIDGAITTLQGTGNLATGTSKFTVKGIEKAVFNPLVEGVGTHRVIYTYTDANTCVNRDTLLVTVHPLPVVAITGLQNEYCAIDASIPLVATPVGGTFTINDAPYMDTNIKLDVLGAGTYNIKYAYTDANNCSKIASKTIVINPLPVLNFIDLQTDYCIDFVPFALQASPTEGTFTIDGATATTFDPKVLGAGEHTVVYSFTDAKNCSQTKTQVVRVNPLPTPTITNLQEAYCLGQGLVTLQATPAGGTFTINGTTATDFNTVTMALGEYEVIYTYQDAKTCINRDTATFTIEPSPIVEITGLQFIYCIDATPFNLTATPHPINPDGFGIFRINGGAPVTQVVPSVLGAGTHTVEYTYTDSFTNCVVVQTKDFEISGLPSVSLVSIGGLKPTYCLGEAPFPLAGIGTPAGGVFTISGVIRTTFDPVAIGAGTHTVIYNYQDVNGCFNTASTEILIYEGIVPAIPTLKKNYCVQNTPFNLVGEPAGGVFSIDGVSVGEASPLFSPAVLGVGEHTIVYKTITACDSIVRKINIFDAPSKLNYTGLEMCSFSGDTITLDAGEGLLYEWSNMKTTRLISVIQSGKYTVTVTDTLGCKTVSDIDIAEKCDPKFNIPTGFTPNGDGLNDNLQIFGQDFYKMEVKIYNRWGELMFITNKKEHGWNGTVGGKPAPAGVYVLTVKYLERPNDIEKQFTSYINLIR